MISRRGIGELGFAETASYPEAIRKKTDLRDRFLIRARSQAIFPV
jgi:hypothetical protein